MKVATLNLIEQRDVKCAQAIKELRSSILFSEDTGKVVALTSWDDPDATWKIGINLAASFAEVGKRTMFLDANLQEHKLSKYGRKTAGLSEYLQKKVAASDMLYETNEEQLNLILSGDSCNQSTELLGGKRFTELMDVLRSSYDMVIVNTPPVEYTVDSMMIGRITDQVFCVANEGKTTYAQIEKMQKKLDRYGCNLSGCIYSKLSHRKRGIRRII